MSNNCRSHSDCETNFVCIKKANRNAIKSGAYKLGKCIAFDNQNLCYATPSYLIEKQYKEKRWIKTWCELGCISSGGASFSQEGFFTPEQVADANVAMGGNAGWRMNCRVRGPLSTNKGDGVGRQGVRNCCRQSYYYDFSE